MTRARTAVVLAAVAVVAVVATVVVAVLTRDGDPGAHGSPGPAGPASSAPPVDVRTVTDPGSGARFEVPAEDWQVRGPRARIYYADPEGRPAAVVRGPAVFRDGYCARRPHGSYRAFAGFTDQSFEEWLSGLSGGQGRWTTGERRDLVTLADGTPTEVRWTDLLGDRGRCGASGIELAMVRTHGVRLVLVADSGEPDTLTHDEVVAVLSTLATP